MRKPLPLSVLLLLHRLLLLLWAESGPSDAPLTPHRMVKYRLRWHVKAWARRARLRTSSGHAACPWRSGTVRGKGGTVE